MAHAGCGFPCPVSTTHYLESRGPAPDPDATIAATAVKIYGPLTRRPHGSSIEAGKGEKFRCPGIIGVGIIERHASGSAVDGAMLHDDRGARSIGGRPRKPFTGPGPAKPPGQIIEAFTTVQVLPFDTAAAQVFDSLRAQRFRVSTMELRIASIALSRSMVAVT